MGLHGNGSPDSHNGNGTRKPEKQAPAPRYSETGYKVGNNAARFYLIAFVMMVAIGLVLFVPQEFPFVVNSYGKLVPAQQWVLEKGADGQLMASTFNYESGGSEGYRVSHFERGSSVDFSFHPSITPGGAIAAGDTIGSILSSEVQERLIALNGELATARSALAVNTSGKKSAVVREAQQRLQFARKKLDEQLGLLERSTKLFNEDLISRESHEKAQSQANLLALEVSIAESHLEATRTGEKPEQLELIHARIAALEDEITAIHARTAAYTLIAPISGTISRDYAANTLLTISDQTRFVVLLPVKWEDYFHVSQVPSARLELIGLPGAVTGHVVSLDKEVKILNGTKVVMATAVLEASAQGLMPGMLAKCKIQCNPVTPLEYVKRLLLSLIA